MRRSSQQSAVSPQKKSEPQRTQRRTKENEGQVPAISGQPSAIGLQRAQAGRKVSFLGVAALVFVAAMLAGCGGGGSSTTPPQTQAQGGSAVVPQSAHVVLVIEENHTFSEVMGQMPWLTWMGAQYAVATNYHANEPGSALDYFWLSSGSGEQVFGCGGWGCPQPIADDNIFRELTKAGKTWKVYAQSLPAAGWMGGDSGAYLERHNPAKWYADVISNPAMQQNIVPFDQLAVDVAANRLPNYSIIIPDANNDAHDGTLAQADDWLRTNLGSMLLGQSYFQAGGDGLMIVTFDECDGAVGACPEQVYTAAIGPKVKAGYQSSTAYKHENTLRTIMDALGVHNYPGAAMNASDMADLFK